MARARKLNVQEKPGAASRSLAAALAAGTGLPPAEAAATPEAAAGAETVGAAPSAPPAPLPAPTAEAAEPAPGEGHRARLRERFAKTGLDGFAEYEVVELVLTLCIPRRDVKPAAKALVARFGNLRGVLDAAPEEVAAVEGVGGVTPVALRIIREAAAHYLRQGVERGPELSSLGAIEDFWKVRLGGLKVEVLEVAFLDVHGRLLPNGVERLEEGTVSAANFQPRKIVDRALRRGAAGLILAHNHPGGKPDPSAEDVRATRTLIDVCRTLQLRVVDHVVVAGKQATSIRSMAVIPGWLG